VPFDTASYFHGQLDEVRIWNVARTPAEIQTDMGSQATGTEANLVAYWKFDQSSGTNARMRQPTLPRDVDQQPGLVLSGVPAVPPEPATGAAGDITFTNATLHGTVNPAACPRPRGSSGAPPRLTAAAPPSPR